MGVLCDKLNQCHWLNDQDKMNLSAELDRIENQLKGCAFYPSLEDVLSRSCKTHRDRYSL